MTQLLPKLEGCPADVSTAQDYLSHAHARLEPVAWHYLQEGSGARLSLRANEQAFAGKPLMPRPLLDVAGGHTRCTLFGQEYAHPILLAPVAYQRLFHPEGEYASAMAASAQDGLMVVSSLVSQPLEEIAQAAQRPLWFQLYWQGERQRTLRLAQRAVAAGYNAIVFTVDAPVKQAVLALPPHIAAVNLEAPLTLPQLAADGQPGLHWLDGAGPGLGRCRVVA